MQNNIRSFILEDTTEHSHSYYCIYYNNHHLVSGFKDHYNNIQAWLTECVVKDNSNNYQWETIDRRLNYLTIYDIFTHRYVRYPKYLHFTHEEDLLAFKLKFNI